MSNELKELLEQQVSYYRTHTVAAIQEKHPGFVVDDYTELLTALEKELIV